MPDDIRSSYAQRLGSVLGDQGAMNMGTPAHSPTQVQAYAQPAMPSIPEEIGIDRSVWATYSPALRQVLLTAKLPDLGPPGIAAVIVSFDRCAPARGFPENPEVPTPPPPGFGNPGAPGGPPVPSSPGVQSGPPPTSQMAEAQPQSPPATQQAFVAPGGMVYVQAFASPGGPSIGYYQLSQPTGIQPAGQAQPGGPQYPPMLGWVVLGGALLATLWMLYEITKMKSELQHGKR